MPVQIRLERAGSPGYGHPRGEVGEGVTSHKRALFPLQAGYCAVTYIMILKVEKALGFVNVFSNH